MPIPLEKFVFDVNFLYGGSMEETFAYLKEVLGIKYLPLTYAAVVDAEAHMQTEAEEALASALPLAPEFPDEAGVAPSAITRQGAQEVIIPVPPVMDSPLMAPVVQDAPASPHTAKSLAEVSSLLEGCTRCKLHKGRKNIVFGAGSENAELMFIGEGPGEQEDLEGQPFVGAAGLLLTKMIGAMGLSREKVYIANVVKCRPPMNRNPEADEILECSPFLQAQIRIVNPKVIVALGTFAAQTLLRTDERVSRLRGRVIELQGRKMIATYHPAYLLRNPAEKKAVWEDLRLAMKELGLRPAPGTKS